MFKKIILLLVAVFLLNNSQALSSDWSSSIGISDGKVTDFSLAIGDFYGADDGVVKSLSVNASEDDLSVSLFLANETELSASAVLKLHNGGMSWQDITLKYGKQSDIYYVPFEKKGPPYGKAHGYYMNKPKKDWKNVKLSDDEIVNLVNVKFLSEKYGVSAVDALDMRASGEQFSNIHTKVKGKKNKNSGSKNKNNKSKNKGKGKNK